MPDALPRFSFSFADLARPRPPELRVIPPQQVLAPAGAGLVEALPRPRWLGRLLPVFRSGEPLRIALHGAAAPAFGEWLRHSLCALFASAGAPSALNVMTWPHELVVGPGDLQLIPSRPHAHLVAAELARCSIAAAADILHELPAEAAWMLLNGRLPQLEERVGVGAVSERLGPRLIRLPMHGTVELAAMCRGLPPAFAGQALGPAMLGLAGSLVRAYLEGLE